ncbi:MAG TPA: class I SAM-dependent methyltransferase [Anaerolineales bacterium]|nr:class I SAM-dependent methyltransferase [Anaerolineales bacterium]
MFRRLIFNFWYLRKPPWDSGISPPELLEFIRTHPTGEAIDLGCGTGTNVVTLAQAGWQVTGVDFVPKAIRIAKHKIKKENIYAQLKVGDVTKLQDIHGPFDLALDIGCFHGISDKGKGDYLNQLDSILAPNGHWLMYGFFKSNPLQSGPGLVEPDIDRISSRFTQLSRQDGFDKRERPSAWFLYQKLYSKNE